MSIIRRIKLNTQVKEREMVIVYGTIIVSALLLAAFATTDFISTQRYQLVRHDVLDKK